MGETRAAIDPSTHGENRFPEHRWHSAHGAALEILGRGRVAVEASECPPRFGGKARPSQSSACRRASGSQIATSFKGSPGFPLEIAGRVPPKGLPAERSARV
jgi:hypothetical protein